MVNQLRGLLKKYEESLVGYLPIKIIDGLILMVTLKVYVNIFSLEEFGRYSIYSKTVSMLYLFTLGWIGTAGFRFAKAYAGPNLDKEKSREEKQTYYSTIVFTYSVIVLGIILGSSLLTYVMPELLYDEGLRLLFPLIILLIGSSMNQLFLTLLIYLDEVRLNMRLVLLASLLKVLMTYVFYLLTDGHIMSILISHGLVDMVLSMIAIHRLKIYRYIRMNAISKVIIKKFMAYGYPLIGLSLIMFLLNSSDQYVVTLVSGNSANAIYAANYTVAASLFTLITMGMNRGVYPRALKFWHAGDLVNAKATISQGFKYFLLIALPAATGLYMISDFISELFLDHAYIQGHRVIGIIAMAMLFYGMSEYMNKGHELKGYTVPIFIHCLIATIINISLNLLLIPQYGFIAAAYTTLIGFFVYFVLSFIRRAKILSWSVDYKSIIRILMANGLMVGMILFAKDLVTNTGLALIITMISAIIVYVLGILIFGVLKEEIRLIRHKG